jgi:hypothetical protein
MRCSDGFWSPVSRTLCGCRSAEARLCTSSRWEEGHIEEWSQISFPDGIVEWAESEFRRVKAKQVLTGFRGVPCLSLPTGVWNTCTRCRVQNITTCLT